MSKLPPEIDSLLWAVAESNDPSAVTDFERRYPAHRRELFKRIAMVRDLRAAKHAISGSSAAGLAIPVFRPTAAAKGLLISHAMIASVGAAAILSAAIGIYAYTSRPEPTPPDTIVLSRTPSEGGPHGSRTMIGDPDQHFDRVDKPVKPYCAPGAPKGSALPPAASTSEAATDTQPPPLPVEFQKPVTMHVTRARLSKILDELASQAQIDIQVAPGSPDPEVRVDYDFTKAADVLDDMGRRFEFTAFSEGGSKILIIPAVDQKTGHGGFVHGSVFDANR